MTFVDRSFSCILHFSVFMIHSSFPNRRIRPDVRDRCRRDHDPAVLCPAVKDRMDRFQIGRIAPVALLQRIRGGQHPVEIALPVIDLRIVGTDQLLPAF